MTVQNGKEKRRQRSDTVIHVATLNTLNSSSGQGHRLLRLIPGMSEICRIRLLAPEIHESNINIAALGHETLSVDAGLDAFRSNPFSPAFIRPFLALLRQLRRFARDAKVLYTDLPLVMICARLAVPSVPRVVEVNGILSEEWLNKGKISDKSNIRYRVMRAVESFACRGARCLVAVSPGIRDYLVSEFGVRPERIEVIPNGIDERLLEAHQNVSIDASETPIRSVALFIGSFRSWHGIHNLIRSMPFALELSPDLCLVLVGDGPTRAESEGLVAELGLGDSIVFTGHQTPEQVLKHLASAHVCVYYPDYKVANYGFMGDPIKLREYMAAGKPIVTIQLPNFAADVESHRCGLVVRPDHREFGKAIAELVHDKELAKVLGNNGRNSGMKSGWKSTANRIVTLIDGLLEE